ncbi:GTPase/DUF3482 domain-containing protein [Desulfoluna spongiiphila]|uniref:50S ribosome-binding GTPase n=1 Tax=Desulfoluna spongiiphila TaxID=419481 RepID=A0A1G5EP26_9BACT|nr:GTPase/DUF3482 domain-containing protein [Desulfoluna spongiiphila]SCY28765.1 50S ribosome-binding GTPase [Desulfoluna spongiiphila]
MTHTTIPEFAILGHPNEGKSTLVSTLTEDDTVRVSPFPGETTASRTYTVTLNDAPLIRFVDTPGFQAPKKTLAWFRSYTGAPERILDAFLAEHQDDQTFTDECELLAPVAKGAGIIYVADGSRPVRQNDLAEMEILRLTGLPRMAVINCKGGNEKHLAAWRAEFRKTFNAVRVFNAHTAAIKDRLDLLAALMTVDPEWEPALSHVVTALNEEWGHRLRRSVDAMAELLRFALTHTVSVTLRDDTKKGETEKKLAARFQEDLRKKEARTREQIRRTFRHSVFDVTMPEGSVLQQDLFDKRTFKLLGLTQKQLATAAATCGGAAGAVIDLAAAGHSLGLFTVLGSLGGAASAFLGERRIARAKVSGIPLGGQELTLGPCRNLQMLFVLLDRILLYFTLITSRSHGKRDDAALAIEEAALSDGGTSRHLSSSDKKAFQELFNAAGKQDSAGIDNAMADIRAVLFARIN